MLFPTVSGEEATGSGMRGIRFSGAVWLELLRGSTQEIEKRASARLYQFAASNSRI
jgi:hypothetical protein